MPPRTIERRVKDQTIKVDLTPKQYDRFVVLSAGFDLKRAPFPGKSLETALADQIKNGYPGLGSAPKNDSNKRVLVNKIVSGYRRAAKGQLFLEQPDIIEEIRRVGRKIRSVRTEVPEVDRDTLPTPPTE